jgi:hypothetical protein
MIFKDPISPLPPVAYLQEGSLVRKRGKFATANLWVTPYADNQRYPAGEHVVQSKECMGLAHWTKEVRCPRLQPMDSQLAGVWVLMVWVLMVWVLMVWVLMVWVHPQQYPSGPRR